MAMPAKGSDRVRAWVYAVINPWADSLALENNVLEAGSVSYRWHRRDFEHLRPIRDHLLRGTDLILDDLIRYYDPGRVPLPFRDGPGEWQKQHDGQLACLRLAAQKAFDELNARRDLTEELQRAAAETSDLVKKADLEGAELERYRGQLTERILNNATNLSRDYSDAEFWNQHRQRFIRYRDGAHVASMDSEREKLRAMNEEHAQKLSELRSKIVDEFDIPPAPWG